MDTPLNIVVVEDHADLREATVAALCSMGHDARGIDCAEALDDELGSFRADLLVLGYADRGAALALILTRTGTAPVTVPAVGAGIEGLCRLAAGHC